MPDPKPNIRHIACSHAGNAVAVAEFQKSIQVWDVDTKSRISHFESTLDFGGTRLAITPDGEFCAIGAYHVHGVALYRSSDGTEVWRRRDLKKVQWMQVSLDGQRILCGFEGKSFQILDLETGESQRVFRGVDEIVESSFNNVSCFVRRKRDYRLVNDDGKTIAKLPQKTFAALSIAFGSGKLCISESTGTVRCFSIRDGKQIWEYDPGSGIHALELTWNANRNKFCAITNALHIGGECQLVVLDESTGKVTSKKSLGEIFRAAFCDVGTKVLCSDGTLRNSATGQIQARLAFFPNSQ